MALGGISAQTNILNTFSPRHNTILRFIVSVCYTFIAALLMAGYIWAFGENLGRVIRPIRFNLDGNLARHARPLPLHRCGTSVIPMPFVPFFILTWIIAIVSGTVGPSELSPHFYRTGYIFPAHSLYELLLQIWTNGLTRIYTGPSRFCGANGSLHWFYLLLAWGSARSLASRRFSKKSSKV
ncbi:hypothetical protein BDW66DRAFT_1473 [Aspergillus desertorum]